MLQLQAGEVQRKSPEGERHFQVTDLYLISVASSDGIRIQGPALLARHHFVCQQRG